MSIDWPSEKEQQILNQYIFKSNENPFGVAQYISTKPVTDFVGRKEELEKIHAQINIVLQHRISRAIRLEGPGGVGKSTLFNYLKESIEKERANPNAISHYLKTNIDILSTYFQVPTRITSFSDLWPRMLDGFSGLFDMELGASDITLPEYIGLSLIYRLFQINPNDLIPILFEDDVPPNVENLDLRGLNSIIGDNADKIIPKLLDYWKKTRREWRKKLTFQDSYDSFKISKFDDKIIKQIFQILNEDEGEELLEQIKDGDSVLFATEESLIEYFNNLMRIYACIKGKRPLILIGIDEFAKAPPDQKELFYQQLGQLFVKLRNSLKFVLFVFISTTDDWNEFDKALLNNSDLRSQINEFVYRLTLTQLPIEDLIQVFKKRMDRFWGRYQGAQSSIAPYYPFTDNSFDYFYRFKKRDLRKTIHALRDLWEQMKIKTYVPLLKTKFDCMRFIHNYYNISLHPKNIRSFEWKLIRSSFNSPERFSTNAQRSSAIEEGLEHAWKNIKEYDPQKLITIVANNKAFKIGNKTRRPDVYIELFGQFGSEYRKAVEFQVKAYKDNSYVKLNEIESSLELFTAGYTDMIFFIMTGAGLNADAEKEIRQIEKQYNNRIIRPVLNSTQVNNLYLLALFKEIMGENIDSAPKYFDTAKSVLENIINQSLQDFFTKIRLLPTRSMKPISRIDDLEYNSAKIDENIGSKDFPLTNNTKPGIVRNSNDAKFSPINNLSEQGSSVSTTSIQKSTNSLSNFIGSKHSNSTLVIVNNKEEWTKDYQIFSDYFPELCGLASYLKDRETGRYKFKFTVGTVEKNVIIRDVSLDKKHFRELVKKMESAGFLVKEKSSFKLTNKGVELYHLIKKANYKY